MDTLRRPKKMAFVALVALAMVLAVNAPSQARVFGGQGSEGDHSRGAFGHPGFSGHSFEGHHFEGHHFDGHPFDGRVHGRFAFVPFPSYGYYPYYGYEPDYGYDAAPDYWYYCPSAGAYYPNVAACPEPWVPVPAS